MLVQVGTKLTDLNSARYLQYLSRISGLGAFKFLHFYYLLLPIFLCILNINLLFVKKIIQNFHSVKFKNGNLTGNLLQIDFICI